MQVSFIFYIIIIILLNILLLLLLNINYYSSLIEINELHKDKEEMSANSAILTERCDFFNI